MQKTKHTEQKTPEEDGGWPKHFHQFPLVYPNLIMCD